MIAAESSQWPPSIVRSKSAERRWVVRISDMIGKELKTKTDVSSSIFMVPKLVSGAAPEQYAPQFLALGPYHHFSPDLYDMERYKLLLTKSKTTPHFNFNFNSLVARISQFDLDIRAAYHRRLDLDADTLALVMAIDGLFLLHILCSALRPLHGLLILSRGNRLTRDALLRDLLKLENQIPLFVLREILLGDDSQMGFFPDVLVGFCHQISPFDHLDGPRHRDCGCVLERAHVLDLLYHMILPEKLACSDKDPPPVSALVFGQSGDYYSKLEGSSYPWKLVLDCVEMLKSFRRVATFVERLVKLVPLVGRLVSSIQEYSGNDRNGTGGLAIEDKTPLLEAGLMVPTASQLADVGVTFKVTGSIKTIKFDAESVSFFLPAIRLGANSEVILRNLVAYEFMAMADCLVFTRYVHLMNCFIDAPDDVRILRDAKIVKSATQKDREIAALFNGMMNGAAAGLSPAKELDEAINGVKAYYEGRPKVKATKIIKKYVYGSWKILTFIATVMIVGLLLLQSFCSLYSCPRLFGTMETTGQA